MSQAVFAAVLNTSVSTVQNGDWRERPSGPSLQLLNVIERKGVKALPRIYPARDPKDSYDPYATLASVSYRAGQQSLLSNYFCKIARSASWSSGLASSSECVHIRNSSRKYD